MLRQPRVRPSRWIWGLGQLAISNLHSLAVLHQGDGACMHQMHGKRRFEGFVGFRIGRCERHEMNDVVDDAMDRGREAADQSDWRCGRWLTRVPTANIPRSARAVRSHPKK